MCRSIENLHQTNSVPLTTPYIPLFLRLQVQQGNDGVVSVGSGSQCGPRIGSRSSNLKALVTVVEYGDPYFQAMASVLASAVVHESCHLATSTVYAPNNGRPFREFT